LSVKLAFVTSGYVACSRWTQGRDTKI